MPEFVLPCSCCGDLIIYTQDVAVRQCAACGTPNARPVATEASADILRHGEPESPPRQQRRLPL